MCNRTVIALLLLLANCRATDASEPKAASPPESHSAKLKVREVHLTGQHKGYKMDVAYPRFSGGDPQVCAALNRAIKLFVNRTIRPESGPDGTIYDFNCCYETGVINQRLVSMRFAYYSYYGGAHGATRYEAFNYQTSPEAKEIKATNLFRRPFPRRELSRLCNAQLRKSLGEGYAEPELNRTQLSNVFLTGKEATFTFGEGELAAFAAGCPEVHVSYNRLRKLLAADAPVPIAHTIRRDH